VVGEVVCGCAADYAATFELLGNGKEIMGWKKALPIMTMFLFCCSAAMMFARREVALSIKMLLSGMCGVDGVAFFREPFIPMGKYVIGCKCSTGRNETADINQQLRISCRPLGIYQYIPNHQ
jgi:hypothetical protein